MSAPSQFLPGTNIQYAWDSTTLGDMKKCARYYQLRHIDGWVARDESIHLRFGSELHTAYQEYEYAILTMSHDDAVLDVLLKLLIRTFDWDVDRDSKAGIYKHRGSLVRTVLWYLDKFKDDPAKTFLLADDTPAAELSFRFELDWGPSAQSVLESAASQAKSVNIKDLPMNDKMDLPERQPYLLCGHLDRVVTYNDALFVMDHKTTTWNIDGNYFDQFDMDNQMTLYSFAGQVVLQAPIKGVIINAAQLLTDNTLPGNTRFKRGFTFRPKEVIEEWLQDLKLWFIMAESFAKANYWPKNDKSCGMYGGCEFREICAKSPTARPRFLNTHFIQLPKEERWNPLKSR